MRRPLATLLASLALLAVLAPEAAANPQPVPIPELGTLVGEGLTVEGPLIQNIGLK